jgi:glycerophosphoryl diester phosphodiesterase
VDRARATGIELDVYAVNDTDTMQRMVELGIDNFDY